MTLNWKMEIREEMKEMAKKLVWTTAILMMVLCVGAAAGIIPAARADGTPQVTFHCAQADENGVVKAQLFDTLRLDFHAVGDEYPDAYKLVYYPADDPNNCSEEWIESADDFYNTSYDWLVDPEYYFWGEITSRTFKVHAEVRFKGSNQFICGTEELTIQVTRTEEITEELTYSVNAVSVPQDDLLTVRINNISGVRYYQAYLLDDVNYMRIGLGWIAPEAGNTTEIPISLGQAEPGDYRLHVTAVKPGAFSKTVNSQIIHVTEKGSSAGKLNLFMKNEYESGEPLRFLAAYSNPDRTKVQFLKVMITPADDPGEILYEQYGSPEDFWNTAFRITKGGNYILKAIYGYAYGANQEVIDTIRHAFTVKAVGRAADPSIAPQFGPVMTKAEAENLSIDITAAGADSCRVTLKDLNRSSSRQALYSEDLIPDENGQCAFRYTQGLEKGFYEIHVSADKLGSNSGTAKTTFLVQDAEASENLTIALEGITVENHIATVEPDTAVRINVKENTGNAKAVRIRYQDNGWRTWSKPWSDLSSIMTERRYDPGEYLLWAEATYDENYTDDGTADDQVSWVPSEVIQLIVASDKQLDEPNGVMEQLGQDGQWMALTDRQVDAGTVLGIMITTQQEDGQEIGEGYQVLLYTLETQNQSVQWVNAAEYNWNRDEKRAMVYTAGLRAGEYKLTLKARKIHYAPAEKNFYFSVTEPDDAPAVCAAVSKTEILTNEPFQVFVSGRGAGRTGVEVYWIKGDERFLYGSRSSSYNAGVAAFEFSFTQGTYVLKPFFRAETGNGQTVYGDEITIHVMSRGVLPVSLPVVALVPAGEDYSFTVDHLDLADISWQVTLNRSEPDGSLSDLVKEWSSDDGDFPGVFTIEKEYLEAGLRYAIQVNARARGYDDGIVYAEFSTMDREGNTISITLDGLPAQEDEYTVYSGDSLRMAVSAPGAVQVHLMTSNAGYKDWYAADDEPGKPIAFEESFASGYYTIRAAARYTPDGDWEGLSDEIKLRVLNKWEVSPSALLFESDHPTVRQGDGLPITIAAGQNASWHKLAVYGEGGNYMYSQEAAGNRGKNLQILLMTGRLTPGAYYLTVESGAEQSDSARSGEQYAFTVTAAEAAAEDEPRLILSQTEVPVNTPVSITVTGYRGESSIMVFVYLENELATEPISLYPGNSNDSILWTNIEGLPTAGEYTLTVETLTKQEEDGSVSWEPVDSAKLTVREYTSMISPFRLTLPDALTEVETGAFDGVDLRVIFLSGADGNTDLSFLKEYNVRYVVTEAAVVKPEGAAFEIVTPEQYQALN